MNLHLKENINLNGLELLKMLSLMVNILIEIENYYSLNMKHLVGVRPVLTTYYQSTLVVKGATLLCACSKSLHKHRVQQLNRW